MDAFWLYFISHRIGDTLIQTEREALNKDKGSFWNSALFVHCLKYTLCFVPSLLHAGASLFWLVPIFVSHLFIDRRWPVIWWRRIVMRGTARVIQDTFPVTIEADQTFHFLVLAVVALFG